MAASGKAVDSAPLRSPKKRGPFQFVPVMARAIVAATLEEKHGADRHSRYIASWAIGGWMWGGTDEAESDSTIHAAVDHGINVIDTAPVYGFGHSEEIVGKAIAEGRLR